MYLKKGFRNLNYLKSTIRMRNACKQVFVYVSINLVWPKVLATVADSLNCWLQCTIIIINI